MPPPNLLEDVLAPAWMGLTEEQRICWHFTAARQPSPSQSGTLRTNNGWQYFCEINAELAVVDEALMLADAPPDTTLPNPVAITVAQWPLPAKLQSGPSVRRPAPQLVLDQIWQVGSVGVVTQGYDQFKGAHSLTTLEQRILCVSATIVSWLTGNTPEEYITLDPNFVPVMNARRPNRTPRVRHVTTIQPDAAGPVPLDQPTGYFATTAGVNKFARIKGLTARRRPDLPLGILRVISTTNGRIHRQTIPNPRGGSPKPTS